MEPGLHVKKYQITATFRQGLVEWRLALETDDGGRHELRVREGEEIPVLLELLRRDTTVHFDPEHQALSTGWNDPGG